MCFLKEAWTQAECFGLLPSLLTPEGSCGLKSYNIDVYLYSSLFAELSPSSFSFSLFISPLLLWNSPKTAIILKEVIITSFPKVVSDIVNRWLFTTVALDLWFFFIFFLNILSLDHSEHINSHATNISNTVLHIVCNHFYSFPSKTDIEQVVNEDSTQSFLILQTTIDWIKYTCEFLQCTQQGALEKASMLKAKEKPDYNPILKYEQ